MVKLISLLVLTSLMLLTIGCYSNTFIKPTQDQVDAYVKENPNLPEVDKQCIYDGRFEVGMRQETVFFLLGEPKEVEIIQQPWAKQEKWTYKQGDKKIFYMEDKGVVGIEEID